MNQRDVSRRRFLVVAIAYSGFISTGAGTALLRASSAWAQSTGNTDELTHMARLLYPHDGIPDAVYAEVVDSILSAAASDLSMAGLLDDAISALDSAQGGAWYESGHEAQLAAMHGVEDEAFFAAIKANVRDRFYTHPKVWEHIGYPGSAVEYGGYIDRGFDDIDWLPEDA